MTPELFIKTYINDAKDEESKSGFSYLISLTQAALESSWGSKALGNNFFGIKWKVGDKQDKQLITTTEILSNPNVIFPQIISVTKQSNGKYKYIVKDWFRKYNTAEEGFSDHIQFFKENPRYSKALLVKDNPNKFFEEIVKAGYATDPNYANNLKAVMKSIIKRLPK